MRIRARAAAWLAITAVLACAGARTADANSGTWPQERGQKSAPLPETVMDIGVSVGDDPRGIRISAVTPDGPADLAGVRAGDVLVEQDGRSLAGMHPLEFLRNSSYVRLGDPVEFTILRDGATFTRKVICGSSVPSLAILTRKINIERSDDAAPGQPMTLLGVAPAAVAAPETPPKPSAAPAPPAPLAAQAAQLPVALAIRRLEIKPPAIAAGSRFTIEVSYVAPPSGQLSLSYSISAGEREVFASSDEPVEHGDGMPTLVERVLDAAVSPGTYRVRVRLVQGDGAVERSATLVVR